MSLVDRRIRQFFYILGFTVFRFRFIFFIFPLILTAILSFGFVYIVEQTTINAQYVFSPENAPWRYEFAVLAEQWPIDEQLFWPGKSYDYQGYVDIVVAGKMRQGKRPNMLTSVYLQELNRINQYILHNMTVAVQHDNQTYQVEYSDLCMSYEWRCYQNDHIIMLMPKQHWIDTKAKFAEFAKEVVEREVQITYPIGYRGTEPLYLGSLVGGVHLIDNDGHFEYAKAIRLTYNVRDDKVANISYVWRKKLTEYLTKTVDNGILEFGINHNESLAEGLMDVADALTPKFCVTAFLLSCFVLLSSIVVNRRSNSITIDWCRSKPQLALVGILCPIISVMSAFGMLLLCGSYYNSIVNVSPFLIMSIGIDDYFIMCAAWHRTNVHTDPGRRLADTLADACVSITITSLTDVLSFAIGCITQLPGVRIFCMYTALGIAFNYLYQLTFFTAAMAFAGIRESNGMHAVWPMSTGNPDNADTRIKRWFCSGSIVVQSKHTDINLKEINDQKTVDHTESLSSDQHQETFVSKLFRDYYGPFLMTPITQLCILLIYIIYITLAIVGCTQIKEGLNPKFLVRDSFYLSRFYELMDETFWDEGLQMQIVINRPPNFFNDSNRFFEMLSKYENSSYTMRGNATMFWHRAYTKHLHDEMTTFGRLMPNSSDEWYQRCRDWLLIAGGRRLWDKDMRWATDDITDDKNYYRLEAFRLQIGLRNYHTPTDHTNSAILMRQIADEYNELNVTTFHEYYPFADQYIELKPSLYRNCIIAIICMMIVALLMIPNLCAAIAIVSAIFSIDIGVLGYMTLWNVRLDSVSMIAVIMSIGFAVDLSAHIAYSYVIAVGNRSQKAIHALETVGWPIFQGAMSTILGIAVLVTVDAYIVLIFFKTVFLVIAFSMIHGLVFLPILLTFIMPQSVNDEISHRKQESQPIDDSGSSDVCSKDLDATITMKM